MKEGSDQRKDNPPMDDNHFWAMTCAMVFSGVITCATIYGLYRGGLYISDHVKSTHNHLENQSNLELKCQGQYKIGGKYYSLDCDGGSPVLLPITAEKSE